MNLLKKLFQRKSSEKPVMLGKRISSTMIVESDNQTRIDYFYTDGTQSSYITDNQITNGYVIKM